jgi:hypothetical protein
MCTASRAPYCLPCRRHTCRCMCRQLLACLGASKASRAQMDACTILPAKSIFLHENLCCACLAHTAVTHLHIFAHRSPRYRAQPPSGWRALPAQPALPLSRGSHPAHRQHKQHGAHQMRRSRRSPDRARARAHSFRNGHRGARGAARGAASEPLSRRHAGARGAAGAAAQVQAAQGGHAVFAPWRKGAPMAWPVLAACERSHVGGATPPLLQTP